MWIRLLPWALLVGVVFGAYMHYRSVQSDNAELRGKMTAAQWVNDQQAKTIKGWKKQAEDNAAARAAAELRAQDAVRKNEANQRASARQVARLQEQVNELLTENMHSTDVPGGVWMRIEAARTGAARVDTQPDPGDGVHSSAVRSDSDG